MTATLSDLLSGIEVVHGEFAVLELGRDAGARVDGRPYITLYIVLEGTPLIRLGDSGLEVRGAPDGYIFIPAGTAHTIALGADAPMPQEPLAMGRPGDTVLRHAIGAGAPQAVLLAASLQTDRSRFETVMRMVPGLRANHAGLPPTQFSISPLMDAAALRAICSMPGASAVLRKIADVLLTMAVRQSFVEDTGSRSDRIPSIPSISAALRLIYENPQHPWSVQELAKSVGMSRSVFASAFAEELDDTPIRFIARIRLLRAARLIEIGGQSIPAVAHLVGYKSIAAFTRAYSREFGVTPGLYRRQRGIGRNEAS